MVINEIKFANNNKINYKLKHFKNQELFIQKYKKEQEHSKKNILILYKKIIN